MTIAASTIQPRPRGALSRAGIEPLHALREQFMTDHHGADLSALPAVIARSWLRSRRAGVDAERPAQPRGAEPQFDHRVIESAEPAMRRVLDGVPDDLACVGLADARGTLAAVRGRAAALTWVDGRLDVGRSLAEDAIGTNAVGTALEEGEGLCVWGAEHYATALDDMVCASAVVRDPLRGSTRAVLFVAMPLPPQVDDLRATIDLVDDAAREIADVLAMRAAPREYALLMAYLREQRKRGAGAVVAIDGRTTLASQEALDLLSPQDYSVLFGYSQESMRAGGRMMKDIVLACDRAAAVCVEPVLAGRERIGSVLHVRLADAGVARAAQSRAPHQHDPFAEFAGESRALRRALDLAGTAAARGLPAHVRGEKGTGKRLLAAAIARARSAETVTIELAGATFPCPQDVERLTEALDRGAAVVLGRVDDLEPEGWRVLRRALAVRPSPSVYMTARRLSDDGVACLDAIGSLEVAMPALDARREDVPALVERCLSGEADRPCRVSSRLMRLFTEAALPGNVAELCEIVRRAAVRCAGDELTTDDLADEDRRALMRIALSPLKTAEAEQIREALRRAGGNRVRAAAMLKIGRSTLYRRLDAYARLGFDLEAETPDAGLGRAAA